MENQKKRTDFLDHIPQPGFLVAENTIQSVNQAAQALLLLPGQCFSSLLHTGCEEYAAFQEGHLCLTLTIGGHEHRATVTRMEDGDLVLLDTDQEADEFRSMGLVSMELRAPLMQAISSAQLLIRQDTSSDLSAARLNRSLMQLLRLVNNMADVSRYTASSQLEIRDAESFFLELFEKAHTLTSGRVHLSYHGLNQPVFTRMDPEQLERAVWNLLSNCIKFTPAGGTIAAKLQRRGRMLYLTIEDSGSGIAENVRGTLFSRYQRQPGIEDSRYGLGLGLTIVRTAAANHGGTVLISRSKEGGTRITMTLAIQSDDKTLLRSPILRPDYAGGWDHALVELADCLPPEAYTEQ